LGGLMIDQLSLFVGSMALRNTCPEAIFGPLYFFCKNLKTLKQLKCRTRLVTGGSNRAT